MTESDAEPDPDADANPNAEANSDPAAATETEPVPNARSTDREPASDGAEPEDPLGVGVVTIAADRTLDADAAGEAVETALEDVSAEYELTTREHVVPSHDRVQSIVLRMIERRDVDVVITAGGTSVEPDDVVIEAVEPLLDKELATFNDLFTALGYEAVGTRVLAARTLAGIAEETPVFCLPGDADAARLGTEEIIFPEASHLVALARDDESADEADGADGERNGTETDTDEGRNEDGTDDERNGANE